MILTSQSTMTRTDFPHLYKRRKDGKLHKWMIWAEKDMLYKQDHLVGGKIKDPTAAQCNGTNIGKKNERTPKEQAIIEAKRTWAKMLDRGYKPDPTDKEGQKLYKQTMTAKSQSGYRNYDVVERALSTTKVSHPRERLFPMLASEWSKHKSKIDLVNGAYVQPKIDGVRCLAQIQEQRVIFTSRTGKEFSHFQHIKEDVGKLLKKHKNVVLDGELYFHSVEQKIDKTERWELISGICSVSRKNPHPQECIIKLYVFDLFDPTFKFTQEERFDALHEIFEDTQHVENVVILDTRMIHSEDEITDLHDEWVADSYEGIIIREAVKNSTYLPGPTQRSHYLLKYKKFDTDEFIIVDAKEGKSTEKGCVIWICQTIDGKRFSCRPQGNRKQRKEWWDNYIDYLGKDLTVKYQGTDPNNGIPRFPVGIDIDRWTKE